MIYWLWNTTIN